MDILILLLLAVLLVIGIVILMQLKKSGDSDFSIDELRKNNEETRVQILKDIHEFQEKIQKQLSDSAKESVEDRVKTTELITNKLFEIQKMTAEKLEEIRTGVDKKLNESLNKRLDESFRQVGERLESLYKSLGELKNLENGVSSLNKTLSNVKSRGIYGELQLGNILANVLEKSQYEENVAIRPKTNERVEFAVKIPDKENKGGFIYLPIDAKFPIDLYNKILEAAETSDQKAVAEATGELKQRIRQEAMKIRDKYIVPPRTTDFAILFLPTESLYAEVLRIDGLAEECNVKYKVILSGPMNITAILSSLAVGFKYLTVNKKSEEILKVLGNFRTQFEKLDELIQKSQKKLYEAQSVTEKMQERSGMIQKSLQKIDSLEEKEEKRKNLEDASSFSDTDGSSIETIININQEE